MHFFHKFILFITIPFAKSVFLLGETTCSFTIPTIKKTIVDLV